MKGRLSTVWNQNNSEKYSRCSERYSCIPNLELVHIRLEITVQTAALGRPAVQELRREEGGEGGRKKIIKRHEGRPSPAAQLTTQRSARPLEEWLRAMRSYEFLMVSGGKTSYVCFTNGWERSRNNGGNRQGHEIYDRVRSPRNVVRRQSRAASFRSYRAQLLN